MSMTVQRLYAVLGELIDKGHSRKLVMINKSSFQNPQECDGAVIMGIESVDGPRWIPNADDDSGTKWNKDGSESGRRVVILKGGAA